MANLPSACCGGSQGASRGWPGLAALWNLAALLRTCSSLQSVSKESVRAESSGLARPREGAWPWPMGALFPGVRAPDRRKSYGAPPGRAGGAQSSWPQPATSPSLFSPARPRLHLGCAVAGWTGRMLQTRRRDQPGPRLGWAVAMMEVSRTGCSNLWTLSPTGAMGKPSTPQELLFVQWTHVLRQAVGTARGGHHVPAGPWRIPGNMSWSRAFKVLTGQNSSSGPALRALAGLLRLGAPEP